MDASLALTALIMGLVGGPHCVAMCGPACAALGMRPAAPQGRSTLARVQFQTRSDCRCAATIDHQTVLIFQLARLLGYAGVGALAAGSMQALGWLSIQAAALRPVWTLVHAAAAVLGAVLIWRARQPVWLERSARRVWQRVSLACGEHAGLAGRMGPAVIGLGWVFLPCGLLYSALLVAALSPGLWQGALVMALFALGSGVSLLMGPWLWLRIGGAGAHRWAIRIAGGALLLTSVWALWMGWAHDAAPWCVAPISSG